MCASCHGLKFVIAGTHTNQRARAMGTTLGLNLRVVVASLKQDSKWKSQLTPTFALSVRVRSRVAWV